MATRIELMDGLADVMEFAELELQSSGKFLFRNLISMQILV